MLAPASGSLSANCTLAGPPSDLLLTFEATATSPAIRGLAVSGAAAKGSVGKGAVSLSSAAIDVAGGRVEGTATFGLGDRPSSASAQWRAVDLGGLLRVLDVSLPVPVAAGLDGNATFAWDEGLETLTMTAAVTAGGTPAPRELPVEGRASLKVTGARWVLDLDHQLGERTPIAGRLSGVIDGSRFAATTVGGRLEATVAVSDLQRALGLMAAVPPALKTTIAKVDGDVSASFDLAGRLGEPLVATTLDAGQLHAEGFGTGTLRAEARLRRSGAEIDSLSAALLGTTIRAGGAIPFDGGSADVTFTGEASDIAAWLETVPARWRPSGRLALNGRVSGPLSGLRVDGTVSSASLAWPFWSPGQVDGDLHLSDGGLTFTARVPSVNGTVRGSLALASPMTLDVLARVNHAALQRLGDIAAGLGAPKGDWKGAATLSARVTGVVDGDRPMVADIGAELLAGEVDGRPIRLVAPARFVASSDSIATEGLRIECGRSTIAAAGRLPAAPGEKRLRVEADGDLGEWWPAVSGRVHAAFEATGSPANPSLNGEATLASATVAYQGYPPMTGIVGRVRLAGDTIELVEARGTWSGAAITADGVAPTSFLTRFADRKPDQATARLRVVMTGLTQQALAPWVGPAVLSQISGQIGAQIDLQASAPVVDALRGTAVITQSDTKLSGLTIRQPRPARLALDRGRIRVADAEWEVGRRTLALKGEIDVGGDRPRLDLSVVGDVDLALTRALVPLALSGRAAIDARVSGDVRRLSFAGGATVSDAGLGLAWPRVAISGVSGRVTLDEERVVIAAKGTMNGGSVDLSGSLPLRLPVRGPVPADALRVRATAFLLEWPAGLRSTIDGDVTYRLDRDGGIISGRVSVEPGAYRRAAPPSFSAPGKPAATGTAGGAATAPSAFDATRLDLSVATRTPGLMDNSYARVQVEGDLHVGGTIGQPAIAGRLLALDRGEVYLRGNVFKNRARHARIQRGPAREAVGQRAGLDAPLRLRDPAPAGRTGGRHAHRPDVRPAARAARPDRARHDGEHVELDEPWIAGGRRARHARGSDLERHPRPGRQDGGARQRPGGGAGPGPDGR